MKKRLLIAITATAIITGCGDAPEPDMDSKNLKETAAKQKAPIKKAKESKTDRVNKVDNKLDIAPIVKKQPVEVVKEKAIIKVPIVYFGFDKYSVSSKSMSELEVFAEKLNSDNLTGKTINIAGHCDEWGADEYNIALGLKRAKATEKALKSIGVTSKMVLTSYGESKPICLSHQERCWKLNRRSEVAVKY